MHTVVTATELSEGCPVSSRAASFARGLVQGRACVYRFGVNGLSPFSVLCRGLVNRCVKCNSHKLR